MSWPVTWPSRSSRSIGCTATCTSRGCSILLRGIQNADESGVVDADVVRQERPAGGGPAGRWSARCRRSWARCRWLVDDLADCGAGGGLVDEGACPIDVISLNRAAVDPSHPSPTNVRCSTRAHGVAVLTNTPSSARLCVLTLRGADCTESYRSITHTATDHLQSQRLTCSFVWHC